MGALVKFFQLLQARVQAGDPDAIKLMKGAAESGGELSITLDDMQKWVDKWSQGSDDRASALLIAA